MSGYGPKHDSGIGPPKPNEADRITQWQWQWQWQTHTQTPPIPRRHTTEPSRLPSRTAHIQTSADLPSQRARASQPVPDIQIVDRRPRVRSTQSSTTVPSRASNDPTLYRRISSAPQVVSSPATAPTLSLPRAPTLNGRISSAPQAHLHPSALPATHRRISSAPQTTNGLATSRPSGPATQPSTSRPLTYQTRPHTSPVPRFSYPLHTLNAEAWAESPRLQSTIPPTPPPTHLQPSPSSVDAALAPPSFRYPRPRPELRLRTPPYRNASTQTDTVPSPPTAIAGDEQTLSERRSFLRRARIVQETMSGLRRRLSGSRRSVARSVSSTATVKCVCMSMVSEAQTRTVGMETGSINEDVDRGAVRGWRVTNAVPGEEAYSGHDERDTEEVKEREKEKGEENEDIKAGKRKEGESQEETTKEHSELPIPTDVLVAGTTARLRRRPSTPYPLDSSPSPPPPLRVPASLATYKHATDRNTEFSERGTVLRRRMSCCNVQSRVVALMAFAAETSQLGAAGEGCKVVDEDFKMWRQRFARLQIEVDRMVAGGLLDQFEGLVERLRVLEDERKAFRAL